MRPGSDPGSAREHPRLDGWVDTPRAVVMIAVDDEDPLVRHVQVVAGNRALNGSAQAFRIDAVEVEGLAEPITLAVPLGESEKSVEDLVGAKPDGRTRVAAELVQAAVLRALETGEKTPAYLDEVCADELGVSPDTVYKSGLDPLQRWDASALARTGSGAVGAGESKERLNEVSRHIGSSIFDI